VGAEESNHDEAVTKLDVTCASLANLIPFPSGAFIEVVLEGAKVTCNHRHFLTVYSVLHTVQTFLDAVLQLGQLRVMKGEKRGTSWCEQQQRNSILKSTASSPLYPCSQALHGASNSKENSILESTASSPLYPCSQALHVASNSKETVYSNQQHPHHFIHAPGHCLFVLPGPPPQAAAWCSSWSRVHTNADKKVPNWHQRHPHQLANALRRSLLVQQGLLHKRLPGARFVWI